jgi:hypothetical protein
MATNKIEILSVDDINSRYSDIEGWFADPSHAKVQISATSEVRLLSASERIESAGGLDRMRRVYQRNLLIKNYEPVALDLAAEPIVEDEIVEGALLVGMPLHIGAIREATTFIRGTISELTDKGLLEPKEKIIYLMRDRTRPQIIFSHPCVGLQTTAEGLQERRQIVRQPRSIPWLGRLRRS